MPPPKRPRRTLQQYMQQYDWNEKNKPDPNFKDTIRLCDAITKLIDDMPTQTWNRGYEYFTETKRKVESIKKTIEVTNKVTHNQRNALERMEAAVKRWIK